jgi:hypothetical protein
MNATFTNSGFIFMILIYEGTPSKVDPCSRNV